jgi:protein TonB
MKGLFKHMILMSAVILLSVSKPYCQTTDTLAGEHLDSLINSGQICFDPVPYEDSVFVTVDQAPEFPGGRAALIKRILSELKTEDRSKLPTRVHIKFVVCYTGEIGKIEISGCDDLFLELKLIEIIRSLPKFEPAILNGNKVSTWYVIPIKFNLE